MSNSTDASLTGLARPLSICESASLEYYTSLILAGVLFFFLALRSPRRILAGAPPKGAPEGNVLPVSNHTPDAPSISDAFEQSSHRLSGKFWEKRTWTRPCLRACFTCLSSYVCSQIFALALGYASLGANLVKAILCLDDTLFWGTVIFFVIYTLVFIRQRLSFDDGDINSEIGCKGDDKLSKMCRKAGLCICCVECLC